MTSCDCSKILLFKKLIFYFLNWTANALSRRLCHVWINYYFVLYVVRFILGCITLCPLRVSRNRARNLLLRLYFQLCWMFRCNLWNCIIVSYTYLYPRCAITSRWTNDKVLYWGCIIWGIWWRSIFLHLSYLC